MIFLPSFAGAQSVLVGARQLQQALGVDDEDADEEMQSMAEELGIADEGERSDAADDEILVWQVPDTTMPLGWIPEKSKRLINDYTGIMSAEDELAMERKLLDCYDSTKVEIAILIVPDLGGDAIESFSQKVWEQWRIGNAEKDNGVLVVVKPKNSTDGQVRIQTGYGMEGALPDAFCKRIIDEEMIPNFINNDYAGGINDALDIIIPVCKGEYSLSDYEEDHKSNDWIAIVIIIAFIVAFIIISSKSSNMWGGGDYDGSPYAGTPWKGNYSGGFGGGSFGGGFGGFGGGFSGGGGASGRW